RPDQVTDLDVVLHKPLRPACRGRHRLTRLAHLDSLREIATLHRAALLGKAAWMEDRAALLAGHIGLGTLGARDRAEAAALAAAEPPPALGALPLLPCVQAMLPLR